MMALIVLYYWKYGSFKHASFWLLLICQLPSLFVEQVGENPSFRHMASIIFK